MKVIAYRIKIFSSAKVQLTNSPPIPNGDTFSFPY